MRVVDDAEPLVQGAQALHGVAGRMLHGLADPMGHRIQPLVEPPGHLGLAAGQRLGHGIGAAGGLALGVEDLAKALLELVGADGIGHRQFRAAPPGLGDHDGNQHEEDEDQRTEADQRIDCAHRPVTQHENDLVHASPSTRFGWPHERIANISGELPVNFYG